MHESNNEHTCMPLHLRNTGAAPPPTTAATAPSLDPLTLSPSQVPPPVTYCVRERQQPIRTQTAGTHTNTHTPGPQGPSAEPSIRSVPDAHRTRTRMRSIRIRTANKPGNPAGKPTSRSHRHRRRDTAAGPARRPLACTHTPRQTCTGGETVSSLCVRPAQLSVIPSLHPGPRFFCEGRAQTGPHAAGPAPPHRAHRQWRSGAAPVVCCLFLWAVAPAATVAARVAWCPRRGAVM